MPIELEETLEHGWWEREEWEGREKIITN
jgi:hypothetical protein